MSNAEKELEGKLAEVAERLMDPPSDVKELVLLLDKTEMLLSKVEQSPSESMSAALHPTMKVLVSKELFGHPDADVRLALTACLSEITRVTAPDAPYDDDSMKEIFQMIVQAFENLNDVSSSSHSRRVSILETVAKVRSCVLMLDLECNELILEMFRHFLGKIRDNHSEKVFSAMEVIMTLVLVESEEISQELLSLFLTSVKMDNADVQPAARRLAESVIVNCSDKLQSCLMDAVRSLGVPLSDYSSVVASVCGANSTALEGSKLDPSAECLADDGRFSERTVSDELAQGSGKMESEVSCPEVGTGSVRSPKSVMSNGNLQPKSAEEQMPLTNKKKSQSSEVDRSESKERSVPLKKRGRKPRVDVSEDAPITELVSKIKKQREKASTNHHKETDSSSKSEENVKSKPNRKRAREEESSTPGPELKYDESLVGRKVKVWWPDDAKFYPGVIVAYNPNSKKHKVLYSDGDKETLLLKNERFEFVVGAKKREESSSTPEAASKTLEKKKANADTLTSAKPGDELSSQSRKGGSESKGQAEKKRRKEEQD